MKVLFFLFVLNRTSSNKQHKKFTVIFVPMKAPHCVAKFEVS